MQTTRSGVGIELTSDFFVRSRCRIYIKYANGVETNYDYRKETRLLGAIKTKKDTKLYQNISYSFTKSGNIKGYTNDCLSGYGTASGNYRTSQSYEYDGLYQLTKVNGTTELNRHGFTNPEVLSKYEQNFSFDSMGNMTEKKSKENVLTGSKKGDDLNYEFDYEIEEGYSHRYARIGPRYYKYDQTGNIICEQDLPFTEDDTSYTKVEKLNDKTYGMDEGWGYFSDANSDDNTGGISKKKINRRTYEWDAENQMTQTSDESLTVNYTYGVDGKRAAKYTHSSETLYFNDYWVWHIDSATRSRGGKVTKNIYLGTERLASRIGSYNTYYGEEKESTFFYHSDHLGSAQLVTDCDGNEYQRLEYTPYGETWMDLKAETSLITKLPYRFSAKELDEETGLYYYGARYLDPKMSRWISADPAMNTGEYFDKTDSGMGGIYNHVNFNLYHYAGNNPIKYTDPDGRETVPYEVQKYLIPWNKKHGAVLPHFTETSKWYLNLTIVNTTNCYAYALNLTKNPITNKNFNSTGSKVFAMQPGILAGRDDELREMPLNAPIQDRAAKIVDLAKADTAKGGYLFTETTIDAPVSKEGNWKVALFIAFSTDSKTGETIYNDYHWYRLEDNGLWSHKQGAMPASDKDAAGQRIYDPKHANRFDPPLNYGYFVGYFEVSQCQSQSQ